MTPQDIVFLGKMLPQAVALGLGVLSYWYSHTTNDLTHETNAILWFVLAAVLIK